MTEELIKVADTIIQKPVVIEVDITPRGRIHALLQKWKALPKKRRFTLAPIVPGSLIKISKILLSINFDPKSIAGDVSQYYETGYKHMAEDAEKLARIIAYAIVNREKDPPQSLTDFILYNFSSGEIMGTLGIVLKQMDVKSFMSSIILVRGMNLLKMSPQDQGS